MENFIDHIEIQNFKSIRHLEVSGFKRINLFLGRPNVGKSNLLEALSLFALPYLWQGSKKLTDLVRLQNLRELLYNGEYTEPINIEVGFRNKDLKNTSTEIHGVYYQNKDELHFIAINAADDGDFDLVKSEWFDYTVESNFKLSKLMGTRGSVFESFVKPYYFNVHTQTRKVKQPFLQPPHGSNLLEVLELFPHLRQTYVQWFSQYGLQLVLDTASHSVKIQKQKSEFEVFQLPYSSIADTLQRIIFYKTAVASNENSVLLFEEPEAHAYPPYITEFTQEVIRSLTNQFFIVTHSPLIVEEFLTDAIDDLGIYLVDFKDGQTILRPLSNEEIYEVRRYGIDLFFNNEAFLD